MGENPYLRQLEVYKDQGRAKELKRDMLIARRIFKAMKENGIEPASEVVYESTMSDFEKATAFLNYQLVIFTRGSLKFEAHTVTKFEELRDMSEPGIVLIGQRQADKVIKAVFQMDRSLARYIQPPAYILDTDEDGKNFVVMQNLSSAVCTFMGNI
jgi:hypothetical protein